MYFPNSPTEEIVIGSPRWEAVLSNDTKCYHDEAIPLSWQELKKYCEDNNLKIKSLSIGFRSNMISLPENKDSYFFRMGERQNLFNNDVSKLFFAGYVENDKLYVHKYKVPEMILDEVQERDVESHKESII